MKNHTTRTRAVLALLISMALPAFAGAPPAFWVSPQGSDSNPGTEAEPFQTLEAARNAVRTYRKKQQQQDDILVWLAGGEYRLADTFALEPQDSGQNGFKVIYRALPGQEPVLMGSEKVTGWSLYDSTQNIYRAKVGAVESRQLYVNGQRAVRARTADYPSGFRPNYSDIKLFDKTISKYGGIEFIPTDLNDAAWRDPGKWHNPSDIDAVIIAQWRMMSMPVDKILPYSGTPIFPGLIKLKEPAWNNANLYVSRPEPTKKDPHPANTPAIWGVWQITRFENSLSFLDEEGEWYLDQKSQYLYYKPRAGEDITTAKVELPTLDVLLQAQGTRKQTIDNVRFEGLTFAYASWMGPSREHGYVSDQSGFFVVGDKHEPNITGHVREVRATPGNIRLAYATHVDFHGNHFMHLGAVGLELGIGSQHNKVTRNTFDDISSAAIQLGGVGPDDHHPKYPAQVVSNNLIKNNAIAYTGRDYVDSAGIMVGFTRHTEISHNTIRHVPWSGIAVGWGWGLLDPTGYPGIDGAQWHEWGVYKTPTTNSHNKILNNRIEEFLEVVWDGGAIYTTGAQGTSMEDALLIEGNFATNKRPEGGGNIFYTDGGTRYVKLKNNVSFNNPVGKVEFGPPPKKGDPLPYAWLPGALDGIPYGGDIGGCRTYGDIHYEVNYGISNHYFDPCPFTYNGIAYPTNLKFDNSPRTIEQNAGVLFSWKR